MAFKQIIALFLLVALGLYIQHMDTASLNSPVKVACQANFYANYTDALATYGFKTKMTINPFYQGNSTCFVECIIKVMKIQVSSLGVIQAPNFMVCTTGTNTKLQKKSRNYCYNGVCLTLSAIATQVANGTFF